MGLRDSGRGGKEPTLLRMISGARYSGVPHKVQVRPFTRLAKPKSVTCGHKSGVGRERGREGPGHGHLGLSLAWPSGYLNVALLVDEKVLWLQVPVDEIERVQILEGQDDLGGVEACMGLAGRDKWRGDE